MPTHIITWIMSCLFVHDCYIYSIAEEEARNASSVLVSSHLFENVSFRFHHKETKMQMPSFCIFSMVDETPVKLAVLFFCDLNVNKEVLKLPQNYYDT